MADPRTSLTDPLRIDAVPVGAAGGLIGVTFCPGMCAASTLGEAWARDVALDVDVIAAWGAQAVGSLIEDHEFDLLKVRDLGPAIRTRGMAWHHLPIEDVHVPDQRFHQAWPGVAPDLVGRTIAVNERPFTIVGITPRGFTGTMSVFGLELFFPLGVFHTVANERAE